MSSIRRFLSVSFASCFAALLLSGCPSHKNSQSSGSSAQTQAVTAQLYTSSTIEGNTTTTIKVALTSATGATSGSYRTEIVDVGKSNPKIDCGNAQYLVPGGAEGSFSCEIPPASLGAGSQHQLQVMVNGAPAMSAPESVEVVEPGLVKTELVSASSGNAVTRAAPGQSLKITFDMDSVLKGSGQYTVDAPAGWLQGNDGTCSLPSSVNGPTCSVAIAIPSGTGYGKQYFHLTAKSGSTPLQSTYLDLDVVPDAVMAAPATVTVLYAQNISATLYGTPSKRSPRDPVFTYKPVIVFENISGASLVISSADVSGLKKVQYSCGELPTKNSPTSPPKCALSHVSSTRAPCPKACYYITGTLDNLLPPGKSTMSTTVRADVRGDSGVLKSYTQPVTFVMYVPDHVAIRIVNIPGKHQVHLTASYNPLYKVDHPGKTHMIDFSSGGVGTRMKYLENNKYGGQAYAEYQYPGYKKVGGSLTKHGGVIYLPYGNSESMYITRGEGFTTQQAATPTGLGNSPQGAGGVASPPFVQFEPTYCQGPAIIDRVTKKVTQNCPVSGSKYEEQLFIDLTYVNSVQYWALLQGMGVGISPTGSINGIPTQSLTFGKTSPESGATLFGKVNTALGKLGSPWKYDKANGTRNFIQTSPTGTAATAGTISMLIAPIQSGGTALPPANPSFNPFHKLYGAAYYKPYLDALWKAVVSGTFKPQVLDLGHSVSNTEQCILVGTYRNSMLVFNAKNASYCKTGASDYPPIKFREFTACDFTIALSSTCPANGLWGPKNSYRVNIGRALATYQAVGLLPQCKGSQIDNTLMSAANLDKVVGKMTTTDSFRNPTCLKITEKPVGYPGMLKYAVYNPYVAVLRPYLDVYTYTFSDFMGVSGLINWGQNLLSSAATKDMPRAQPITLTLY